MNGVVIDWEIPVTRPGPRGALERFFGPGSTRTEIAVQAVGGLLVAALLAVQVWRAGVWAELGAGRLVLLAVVALDLVGGVLTNATNAAKRWYHRPGTSRGSHLRFTATHLLHLGGVAFVLLDRDVVWFVVHGALLLAAAALIVSVPLEIRRPTAMAAWMVAVLAGSGLSSAPTWLWWFAPLFFLKLLVSHLVPEAPMRTAR